MPKPVVLDNTVLSNFARVGRPELVTRLWNKTVFTTPGVMNEHLKGVKQGLFPDDAWVELPIAELTTKEDTFCRTLPSSLGAGEKGCIAVAHHRKMVLATDDLDARKTAFKMGLPTTGTVGILMLCVSRGLLSLDEGNRVLALMIEGNYHSPITNLKDLM